jgi:hypothetical protein
MSAAGTHAGAVSGRFAGSSPAPPRHPRLVICGRDGKAAEALNYSQLEGIHRAMTHYRSDELIPRLLATIEALRVADDEAELRVEP